MLALYVYTPLDFGRRRSSSLASLDEAKPVVRRGSMTLRRMPTLPGGVTMYKATQLGDVDLLREPGPSRFALGTPRGPAAKL